MIKWIGFIGLGICLFSCRTPVTTLNQLHSSQRAEWDSLYTNWISNGMGTCTPMMEEQLKKGDCDRHELIVALYINSTGTITKIKVVNNNIQCADKNVAAELCKCMLETIKTDFVFAHIHTKMILETSVGLTPGE